MAAISKELIDRTKLYFSPLYGYDITDEEAAEIATNLHDFAELLIEIYEKDQMKKRREPSD